METEPNNSPKELTPLPLSTISNGRFLEENDEDWFELELTKEQPISIEILAQRYLRSPVDTLIENLRPIP